MRFIDGELWKIIINGDLPITQVNNKPVAFNAFSADDWSRDEKNMKELKLLTSGLDNSNRRNVLGSIIAKEKWDASAMIY